MDRIDRKICEIVQANGRASSAEIGKAVGVSLSTANERVRRLTASGAIKAWRAIIDPVEAGVGLCAFMLIDMSHQGENEAVARLAAAPEVQELHHISGAHSYLAKIRVADTPALQGFLRDVVKPLPAVQRSETIFSLEAVKETTELAIAVAEHEKDD